MEHSLGEDEAVACLWRWLLDNLRVFRAVRECRRCRKVALVRPRHDTESPVTRLDICQLHAHRKELRAHVAVDTCVLERPCWGARLRDRPAVQRVPLAPLFHRNHERRVVQSVAHPEQLRQHGSNSGVGQDLTSMIGYD